MNRERIELYFLLIDLVKELKLDANGVGEVIGLNLVEKDLRKILSQEIVKD